LLKIGPRYRTATVPSKLAFGAGRLGAFWQGRSLLESKRALEAALTGGINLIDTADVYALGISERLIGHVLKTRREAVVLCTKLGQLKTPRATIAADSLQHRLSLRSVLAAIPRKTPRDVNRVPRCFESRYLQWAMARSLRRLRAEHVDILLLHSPTREDIAGARFESAAHHFLRTGVASNFGVSCDDVETALAASRLEYVSYIELPVDIAHPASVAAVEKLRARGVGVLARSPFGGGALLERLRPPGSELDEETAACCLQAVSEIPGVLSTIVGMRSAARVETNLRLLHRTVSPERRSELLRALHTSAPRTAVSPP
jgi:aryl-alcohol dehydrogenase-like predicted oxidoreductase